MDTHNGNITEGTLLVVDDDPTIRMLLSESVKNAGNEVIQADNGEDGLEMCIQHQPDAVLLDLLLPGLDGLEVCRRIRATKEIADTPILIITGVEDEGTRARIIAAGANDYLLKPFTTADVLIRLKQAVQTHHLQVELEAQTEVLQKLEARLNSGLDDLSSEMDQRELALGQSPEIRRRSTAVLNQYMDEIQPTDADDELIDFEKLNFSS